MFKRVERKRKKREEDETLQLDEDVKEMIGLNDTDSDESESDSAGNSENDAGSEEGMENLGVGDEGASEGMDMEEEPPILVAEALKDPIYLISLEPTAHGCMLCKGKLIKGAEMAVVHRNSTAHKRRFERFKALAIKADQGGNAWDIVKSIHSVSVVQRPEPEILSGRALKRQAKQSVIREKRRRHKDLKAKAIAKRASKKPSKGDDMDGASATLTNPPDLPTLQDQDRSDKTRKKRKIERKTLLVETE
ncbi:hypothetical protein BU15DRAFT_59821 [Melanogaster broomeanus]|nr:hypothetical protein BU15DRAFT_59821 [Melanogaster broomeanus]